MNQLPFMRVMLPEWRMILGFVHCPPAPVVEVKEDYNGRLGLGCSKCTAFLPGRAVVKLLEAAVEGWQMKIAQEEEEKTNGDDGISAGIGIQTSEPAGGDQECRDSAPKTESSSSEV